MTTALAMCLGAALMLALVWLRRNYASFRAQRPDHYAHLSPPFDLRQHLSGPLVLEGILYGPTGRVTSRFVADAEGLWQGDDGTLRETFHYDSGRIQTREWKLRLLPDNRIEGRAEDVDGVATGRIRLDVPGPERLHPEPQSIREGGDHRRRTGRHHPPARSPQ